MNKAAYLQKFKVGNPNQDHFIADQVFQGFKRKLSFGRIMQIIKTHGNQFVYNTWNDIRQQNCRNPIALFLWKVKQNKIDWKK